MSRAAVAAGLAALAVLVAGAWWLAGRPTDPADGAGTPATPAATEASPTPGPGRTAAGGTPTATPTGEASPTPPTTPAQPTSAPASPPSSPTGAPGPPTPSPAAAPDDGPPLVGGARVTGEPGGLVDSAGQPPPDPAPAADLVAVELDGDGRSLRVTWSLAAPVPGGTALLWSLDLWAGGEQVHTVTVQQAGARLVAGVLDWRSGEQHALPAPAAADGARVTLEVPAELLAGIDGPFQWQALGQVDGGYEDYLPGPGTLAWFPDEG